MSENLVSQNNGLTNSKLGLATATEADVLAGKTFYANNKDLKTGNYTPSISTIVISSGTKTGPMTITISDPSIIYVIAGGWISNAQPNNRPTISGSNIELEKLYGYGINSTTTMMYIKITNYPATITMDPRNSGWQLNYTFAGVHLN